MQSRSPEPPPPLRVLPKAVTLNPQSVCPPSLAKLQFPRAVQDFIPRPLSTGSSPPSTVGGSVSSEGSPRSGISREPSLSPQWSVLAPHAAAPHAQRAQYWSTVLTEKPQVSEVSARGNTDAPYDAQLRYSSQERNRKARSLISNMTQRHERGQPPPQYELHAITGAIRKRGRFQCHMCTATFAQRGDMMRHIRVKGPWWCAKAPKNGCQN